MTLMPSRAYVMQYHEVVAPKNAAAVQYVALQRLAGQSPAEAGAGRTWGSAATINCAAMYELQKLAGRDPTLAEALRYPGAVQFLGSVEFCTAGMALTGVPVPEPLDYPEPLRGFMASRPVQEPWRRAQEIIALSGADPFRLIASGGQEVDDDAWRRQEILACLHLKPVQTKLPRSAWRDDTPVWLMRWHPFDAEFRAYVLHGEVVAVSDRYDAGPLEDAMIERRANPEGRSGWLLSGAMTAAQQMAAAWMHAAARGECAPPPVGYAIDVGYTLGHDTKPAGEKKLFEYARPDLVSLQSGFSLVEVNDGWALGLYKGASARLYAGLLEARWAEMAVTSAPRSCGGRHA